jgi:pimeloyl-ACP methyl ester carboxylesterase
MTRTVFLFLSFLAFGIAPVRAQETPPALTVGAGDFRYEDPAFPGKPLTIHYYRPADADAASAPVLFVMHGTLRNGAEYRDLWIPQAKKYRVLLVVPEFGRKEFPSGMYNRGNVRGTDDAVLIPEDKWTFGVLERLFDRIRAVSGNRTDRYYLYGHSAGGQFVHRFLLFQKETRCARAVAANAGYYTMPTTTGDPAYPFSLKATPLEMDAARYKAVFVRELVILLGEEDTDPKDPDLYHSPEADAQGMHRFARGKTFYAAARREAERSGTPLRWTLRTVPGVGHSNEKMAPAAADALFGGTRD